MNILITGIVSSGKSNLARQTQETLSVMDSFAPTEHISLGNIYAQLISQRFNIPKENVGGIEETLAIGVREGLLTYVRARHMQNTDAHYLIDLPLTIFRKDHRTVRTFGLEQIRAFNEFAPIDYIVCTVPPTIQVSKKLDEKALSAVHPTEPETLLGWIAAEVLMSQNLAEILKVPLLIVPSGHSESTVAKIIFEHEVYGPGSVPPSVYLAQPISNIKLLEAEASALKKQAKEERGKKKQSLLAESSEKAALAKKYRRQISEFRDTLQQHAIVINPIELADMERGDAHYSHTFHRDLYWFVHYSDMTVAYFPATLPSTGADREIAEVKLINKPCALVHPDIGSASDHPFKSAPPPRYRFSDKKSFFKALSSLPNPFNRLRAREGPRYASLYRKQMELPRQVHRARSPQAAKVIREPKKG